MADLLLDSTGDIDIDSNFNLRIVDGIDAIIQHLKLRLQFFRGEWFLDTRIGMPWFEEVLRKAPDLSVVQSLVREAITTTPGVTEISEFSLDYDGVTRTLSISFRATTESGPLEFSEDFVIPSPTL